MWDRWDRDLEHLMKKLLDLLTEETSIISIGIWLVGLGYEWNDLKFLGFTQEEIQTVFLLYDEENKD